LNTIILGPASSWQAGSRAVRYTVDVLDAQRIQCPYCGETIDLSIDRSNADCKYIEDCQVCCRPMVIQVSDNTMGGALTVTVRRDDE